MSKHIILNRIETPDGTILISEDVHDYKEYVDANGETYMVDGGTYYLSRMVGQKEPYKEMSIYNDDPIEIVREHFKWGTYGINGDQPLTWILLKDMETDHIKACIEMKEKNYIEDDWVYPILKRELEYRKIISKPHKNEDKVFLEIMPVSVIDIEAQKKRKFENHGNTSSRANFSPFPKEISILCYEFFLKNSSVVFDPFAGWGERHYYANKYNKKYIGYDVSIQSIERAKEEYNINNINVDSLETDPPEFDGFLTCPPYWNLEKYDSDKSIDRNRTFELFIKDYKTILNKSFNKAKEGTIFCIMVGNWRKNHTYYDLQYETDKIFKEAGLRIIDKIIVSRKKVSKIKIMLPQAKRLGYSVNVHEYLLVYKKGDN